MEFEELLKKSVLEKPSKDIIKLWKYRVLYQRKRYNMLDLLFYYIIPITFSLTIFTLKLAKVQIKLDIYAIILLFKNTILNNYLLIAIIIVYLVLTGLTRLFTD